MKKKTVDTGPEPILPEAVRRLSTEEKITRLRDVASEKAPRSMGS